MTVKRKRLLRLDEVKNRTGLCRSGIYKKITDGKFPKQIHLGKRSVAWLEEEVDQWIDERINESRCKK